MADVAMDVLATTACIQPHPTDMDTVFSVTAIADSVSEALAWYDNMVIEVTQHAKDLTKVRQDQDEIIRQIADMKSAL